MIKTDLAVDLYTKTRSKPPSEVSGGDPYRSALPRFSLSSTLLHLPAQDLTAFMSSYSASAVCLRLLTVIFCSIRAWTSLLRLSHHSKRRFNRSPSKHALKHCAASSGSMPERFSLRVSVMIFSSVKHLAPKPMILNSREIRLPNRKRQPLWASGSPSGAALKV